METVKWSIPGSPRLTLGFLKAMTETIFYEPKTLIMKAFLFKLAASIAVLVLVISNT
jgi:hypothetical protein